MNHDPTPTSPADPDPNSNRHRDEDNDTSSDGQQNERRSSSITNTQRQHPKLSQKAKEGLSKKLSFLLHLLLSLDTLIYAELCTLYYMDCSFFRLIIRWIPHWLFLSMKSDHVILPLPNYPVGAIFGPNAFCMFLHIVSSLPKATEASRGYLHGGVLIDFVGQKAPTSKLTLLLLDVVVLGLQCFMLAVSMEKDRIKKTISPPRPAESGGSTETTGTNTGQDHDAEERGVLRDAPTMEGNNDIEMQSLRNGDGGDEEQTALLDRERSEMNSSHEELGDVLSSGNAILADLHVRHALRTSWNDSGNTAEGAAAYALQNVGYNATLAALAAQRRARLATGQVGGQGRRS
ncbi:hypothetical protein BJ170DRAFT_455282 [Xylariales sp. AK1849]|nr:hypothetical protein BJ170DRAFT_455282 [Xylariales sp. AK1849]